MLGGLRHATVLGRVGHGHALVAPTQPKAAHRLRDVRELSVHAPQERDLQLFVACHRRYPVTSSRLLPRLAAISSGERTRLSAAIVARTTLIGLRDP